MASVPNGGLPGTIIQALTKDQSLKILDAASQLGVSLLKDLQHPLKSIHHECGDAVEWLRQIERCQKSWIKTPLVISFMGSTGSGKSSTINALLDEERIVPTSCVRACTAVITEISYNDQEIPYRAVVEFIDLETDWRRELELLYQDLFDEDGEVRENAFDHAEAKVALAKIRAVYPKFRKMDVQTTSVEDLIKHENLSGIGGTKTIEHHDPQQFYRELQEFVDSREKVDFGEQGTTKTKRAPKKPSYWPLIKVVKIFLKSKVLESGARIVDLPGIQDANAARAEVAETYAKECSSIFVVAPINRAVDDKTAKTLLNNTSNANVNWKAVSDL